MSSKVYRIAFVPVDAFGHVNACLALAHDLRERGHKCVFIANQNWSEMIEKYGFENKTYIAEHKLKNTGSWADFMAELGPILKLSSFEKLKQFQTRVWKTATDDIKLINEKVKQLLNDIKPDAIVVDSLISIPAVTTYGVPWIDLCSCNPLYYFADQRLPPSGSGYPTYDKSLWQAFRDEAITLFRDQWVSYNSWLLSQGSTPLTKGTKFNDQSPFLNIYLCPKEINYEDIAPQDSKWFGLDSLIRQFIGQESHVFKIPEKLKERSGSLVYLSMGTLVSKELNLMKRLLSILAKSKHRFILSMGQLGDELELSDNMWGQNSVPQLQVLPVVDLVITHGGNNTVTESLYFGKPMIVLPIFGDQYNNAQRVEEKGLGVRLDPYYCSETDLLNAIEKLANDSDLKQRYQQISDRIKESKSRENAAKLIENLIDKEKNKLI